MNQQLSTPDRSATSPTQKVILCRGCGALLARATPDARGLLIGAAQVVARGRLTLVCQACTQQRDWHPPRPKRPT